MNLKYIELNGHNIVALVALFYQQRQSLLPDSVGNGVLQSQLHISPLKSA